MTTTAIAIDLGGTKIKAGLIDDRGNILKETQIPTRADHGRGAVLDQLDQIVRRFKRSDTIGGGIGSPGIVDPRTNTVIEFGYNIEGWHGSHITEKLEQKYPELIWRTENDANCAALGELWQGAAKGIGSFIMITLGTGVGGSVYQADTGLQHGAHQLAGELGHMVLYPEGRACNCGQYGCVEQYLSGTALKKLYRDCSGAMPRGSIFALIGEDACAEEIVRNFEKQLGLFFVTLTHAFDPDAFVIGGGLIHEKDVWWKGVERAYREGLSFRSQTKLLPAKRLNEAGMLGAAYLVFQ